MKLSHIDKHSITLRNINNINTVVTCFFLNFNLFLFASMLMQQNTGQQLVVGKGLFDLQIHLTVLCQDKQGRNSRQNLKVRFKTDTMEVITVYWLVLVLTVSNLYYIFQDYLLSSDIVHSGLEFPHYCLIKKPPTDLHKG